MPSLSVILSIEARKEDFRSEVQEAISGLQAQFVSLKLWAELLVCFLQGESHHSILLRPPDPALNPWESQPQITFYLRQCPWHPGWLPSLTFLNFHFRDFWYFNIFKFNFASMWMNRLCWTVDLSWSPRNDYSSQRSRVCGNAFKHLLILLPWFRKHFSILSYLLVVLKKKVMGVQED